MKHCAWDTAMVLFGMHSEFMEDSAANLLQPALLAQSTSHGINWNNTCETWLTFVQSRTEKSMASWFRIFASEAPCRLCPSPGITESSASTGMGFVLCTRTDRNLGYLQHDVSRENLRLKAKNHRRRTTLSGMSSTISLCQTRLPRLWYSASDTRSLAFAWQKA